jgi:hypothetical protein
LRVCQPLSSQRALKHSCITKLPLPYFYIDLTNPKLNSLLSPNLSLLHRSSTMLLMNQSTYQPWFSTSQPCGRCLSTKGSINLHNQNHTEKKEKQLIMVSWSHECKYEIHTRGVSIGCAVVEDAKSSCCILWIRLHLYWKIDVNTFPFLLYILNHDEKVTQNLIIMGKKSQCYVT